MKALTRLGVVVTVCLSAMCACARCDGQRGRCRVYSERERYLAGLCPCEQHEPGSQTFVMRDVANRITGNWGEFTLSGTFSPSTMTATLCAGCGQRSVLQTTNWQVKFTFKSTSTAQSNHPTLRGTSHYVSVTTGAIVANSTASMRAVRCSYQTNAKAVALCG